MVEGASCRPSALTRQRSGQSLPTSVLAFSPLTYTWATTVDREETGLSILKRAVRGQHTQRQEYIQQASAVKNNTRNDRSTYNKQTFEPQTSSNMEQYTQHTHSLTHTTYLTYIHSIHLPEHNCQQVVGLSHYKEEKLNFSHTTK